jgi:putative transposon-encoded protein
MRVKRTISFDNYYGDREATVKPIGNSAHVLVPKSWIDKRVMVILQEPVKEED